jgi:hypothetical protein
MPPALIAFAERLAAFIQQAGLWWGIAISLALALGSLAVAVVVVIGWSPQHFTVGRQSRFLVDHPPALRAMGIVGKNLAGIVMFLIGFVMALPGIPGQGVLTMIIAVTLIDFPGKRNLERRLVGRPWVLKALNNVRRRFNRPPLDLGEG